MATLVMDPQADLLARIPRCERAPMPHLKRWDVVDGDDRKVRRMKWGQRAMTIWTTPCSNNPDPDGRSYDCPRCTASFLRAVRNPPEGPWA